MEKSKSRDWSKLVVSNNLKQLPVMMNYVRTTASMYNYAPKSIQKIELAVEEAVTNVIKHAFAEDENATFEIICNRLPQGLEITIHDEGLPFDPSKDRDFQPEEEIDDLAEKGLGSFLIKNIMDEFEYRNLGFKGKETRFVKHFDSKAFDETKEDHPAEVAKPVKAPIQKIDFDIRYIEPEEAIEVCRCVYDSYGYSYANEHIYYPERVEMMNESGQIKSAVAVTKDGEVGGHFAVISYEQLPREIGIAVTKKKFRGQKMAGKLAEFLENNEKELGEPGLQVREVTVHPYTQKFCQKLGYVDCGYLLMHSPTTMSFKGIADELKHRNTDIVGFKYFKQPENKEVYAPIKHWSLIKKIYNDLGVNVELKNEAEEDLPQEKTISMISNNSVRSVSEIHFLSYGKDVFDVLKEQLRFMRQNEIKVAEMYLSMDDEFTPYIARVAEQMGFFFTGILPETKQGDALIMQYFNGIEMDYDSPQIVSDTAKELLQYIRENDPQNQ